MALDKILIGSRIRKIREEVFEESRNKFGNRYNLTERHIGQIERGDFLLSLSALDNIAVATGVSLDDIVYGKCENDKFKIKNALNTIIDRSDERELEMYYGFINTIKNYVIKAK